MGREVRITIDDDEVFERMKRRKRELDLSWEEVLHRGLRREPPDFGTSPSNEFGPGAAEWRRQQPSRRQRGEGEYEDQWDRFADSVEAQVQNKVYNALRNTFGMAGIDVPESSEHDLEREMQDLSSAEDAVLSFDFLGDNPAYKVPLRVNLETSVEGLKVDVVAVRHGKNVREMNQFDSDARLEVTKRIAEGKPAVLRLDGGAEGYEVEPIIRWERDDAGYPTVTSVEIESVRLNENDVE